MLCDWIYSTFTEHMDKKDKEEFDYTLDGILYAEERANQAREARREIARLNKRS